MIEKLAVISRSPLFEMLSDQELEHIANLSKTRHFEAGQTVFEEGELGSGLYVITRGEVEVFRRFEGGEQRAIAVFGPPEFFGEMSLIDIEYRSATVRARTEAEMLHLTAEDLTDFRNQYRDGFTFVVINIARVLSARLRDANKKLESRA